MEQQETQAEALFRQKFAKFCLLREKSSEESAWEEMVTAYSERQKKQMGPLIEEETLAQGFSRGIPIFARMGLTMEVFDISNNGMDAAIEAQKNCPALQFCHEYGFEKPCHVICEMDVEASRRAFPDMNVEILSRQAEGACVCLFKYERKRREESSS
jgi:predicted ArsR family transcriptional regulator